LFDLGNINLISSKLDSLGKEIGKESEKEYSLIPIEKHTNKAPLSYAQERLWFSFQEDPESIKYNMPILVDFKGVFSVSKIKDAFVKIVNRHEILRTAFVEGEKGIFQKVLNKIEFDIKIFDLTRVKSLSEADIKKTYYAEVIRCFDLRKNPPFFNVSYVKVSKKRSILLLNMHHIIADEESVKIILKELNDVLNLKKLHSIKVQYSDYSAWEKSVFEKQKLKESLVFLEKEFNPFPRKMNLKNLHKTLTKKTKFNILTNKIALNTLPNLREIQKKHNVTITHLLLSVYAILLYRYTAQSSILIAMPVSSREGNELQSTVGFFVDMILIKIDIDYSDDFLTVLNQVKNKVISGAGNQRAPLQILIENLRRQYPDLSSNNIQCAFNSTRINTEGTINHVDYQISSVNSAEGKVPLTLTANTSGADLLIQCEYSGDFCNKEMKRFVDNFVSILTKLENSKTPIMLFDIFNNRIQKLNSLSKNITPLTQIQKDLYLEGEVSFNGQYLIGGYFFTEGSYQVEVIKKIINFIFKKIKFQNLRICKYFDELYMYETKNDGKDLIYEFEINDLGNIEEELYENAQKIISLSDSSLIRPILIYKENKLLAISLMAHHVIVDAISLVQISILVQKIYKSYGKNQKLNDFNFETMYSNRSGLFAKEFKENNSFWEGKLQSVITPPSMVPTQNLGKLNKDDLILNNHVRKKLKVIQRKHNVSLFSILISIYVLMLHKMHNFKNNIVFNEPETTRNNLKTMILGVYVNIIPLVIRRSWLDKDTSFIEFVKKVEEYRSTEKPYISMNNQALLIQGETIFGVNHIPLFGKSFFSTGSVGKNEVQFTVYSSKTPFVRFSYHYGFFGDGKPTNSYELVLDAILDDDTKKLKNINIVSLVQPKVRQPFLLSYLHIFQLNLQPPPLAERDLKRY
jgi:hypothetical protein